MLVLGLHDKRDKLLEQRDGLHRLFCGAHMPDVSEGGVGREATHSIVPCHGWERIVPVPLVVRSSVGSWNMSTTPSDVMCTSGVSR